MTSASIILLAIKTSLALIVFSIGLHARTGDAHWLFRHPALLARSILSMNVIMPLLALTTAVVFRLHPAVEIALVALALSPSPPILPNKAIKSGGEGSYAIGLLGAVSLLSIVFVPLGVWILSRLVAAPARLPASAVAMLVGTSMLGPLIAGLAVRRFASNVALRIAKPISTVATLLLLIALIPILTASWAGMKVLIGNGTLFAIVAMTIIGLAVGHLLGGPRDSDRPVLALATASRHPAMAIAIGQAMFPGFKLVAAAVLLDLLVVAVVSIPYTRWSKRAAHGRLSPSAARHFRSAGARGTAAPSAGPHPVSYRADDRRDPGA